jgi:hypothetical protein
MSAQAMHRVCTHGPEDHELFRLMVVIADFADTAGRDAAVGQRVLAERVKVSKTRIYRLVQQAVCEGWLAVDKPGGPRRRAVYNLGPLLLKTTVTVQKWTAASQNDAQVGPYLSQSDAQIGPRTVNGVGRSSSRRPPSRDGRATAVENLALPDVPPGPSRRTRRADSQAVAATENTRYRGLPDWTAQRLDTDT